jgi:minor histocompatibility antigen H13
MQCWLGVFVALLLRFDREQASEAAKAAGSYATPYFNATYAGYIIGLLTTIVRPPPLVYSSSSSLTRVCLLVQGVMHFFKAAQPALLYLVPACLLTSFGTALARGEVAALLAYSEEEDESAADDKKSE